MKKQLKKFIGANLKLNPVSNNSQSDLIRLLTGYVSEEVGKVPNREVAVFVPTIFLRETVVKSYIRNVGNILAGAQEVSEHTQGAYTGDSPSPLWLTQLGITDVLVGHSEDRLRYEVLGANPNSINTLYNKKISNALHHGLRVTYCVGETLDQKNSGRTKKTLEEQIEQGLSQVPIFDLDNLIIAYEPRWTIGTGKTPSEEDIRAAHQYSLDVLVRTCKIGDDKYKTRVIYGGGVSPENTSGLLKIPCVDGLLVGGASLDAHKFSQIVKAA
ncbi:MAG: triose-phosphate isomerase [archaeon]